MTRRRFEECAEPVVSQGENHLSFRLQTRDGIAPRWVLNRMQVLDLLRALTDGNGRPVAAVFLKLPSPKALPDYYQVILWKGLEFRD